MVAGVTTEDRGARSMPTGGATSPVGVGDPARSAHDRAGPETPVEGKEVHMIRCPIHGIAYDSEREVCPECAKGAPPGRWIPRQSPRPEIARANVAGRRQDVTRAT
jgi:hypothetical protein